MINFLIKIEQKEEEAADKTTEQEGERKGGRGKGGMDADGDRSQNPNTKQVKSAADRTDGGTDADSGSQGGSHFERIGGVYERVKIREKVENFPPFLRFSVTLCPGSRDGERRRLRCRFGGRFFIAAVFPNSRKLKTARISRFSGFSGFAVVLPLI